jgi:glyoxylase-like metal-dependent hydrolase (beta-lactamase superfamily II)
LKREYPDCKIAVGKKDVARYQNPASNLAIMLGIKNETPPPDLLLEEGSCIALGRTAMRVMETPGHTPGSISLLASREGESLLFCGDLVFADGVGRTDLPGGDFNTLQESITQKVFSLPENTHLYPGHGPRTTVAQAKNIFRT